MLYRIAPDGSLAKTSTLPVADLGMVHDFMVTQRHIVIPVTPLVLDRALAAEGRSYLDSHRWRPELGLRVLVIDKDNLQLTRRFVLPPGFILHYGNGWEEADGTIRLDCCYFADPSALFETLRYVMQGEWRARTPPHAALIRFAAKGDRTELETFDEITEFPRVDSRRIGRRYRHVWSIEWPRGQDRAQPGQSAIVRRDLETGRLDRFDYGAGAIAEEHMFVPRPGREEEGDGWVVGTSFDIGSGTTSLAVFDALALAAGPLAVAHLSYALPLGFHGTFVPA